MNELVGRINGAFSSVDWVPIHYVHRSLTEQHVVALYRAADVMLVTPLRDGMNLVAKEFVTARPDEDGVLVLSEFAGAAAEMGEALQVNPYDIETMSHRHSRTRCAMPEEERKLRMRSLRRADQHRAMFTIGPRAFIDALGRHPRNRPRRTGRPSASPRRSRGSRRQRLRSAERLRAPLLDYDGTLVPVRSVPGSRGPRPALFATCWGRSPRSRACAFTWSAGARRARSSAGSGTCTSGLHAEHGYWSRMAPPTVPGSPMKDVSVAWKLDSEKGPGSRPRQQDARRPRRREDGEPGLALPNGGAGAWRRPRAEELWHRLQRAIPARHLGQLLRGEKVIEVRPEAG